MWKQTPELNSEVPDPGLTAGQLCCERYLDKRTKARTAEGKSKVTQLIGSRSRSNPQVYFLLHSQPTQIVPCDLDMGEKAHSSMGQELGSWEPMASLAIIVNGRRSLPRSSLCPGLGRHHKLYSASLGSPAWNKAVRLWEPARLVCTRAC